MKRILLLSLMVLFCLSLSAQKQKEYIQKKINYSVARIYKKNYKIIKVNNLKMINDTTITFNAVGSAKDNQIPVSELRYISVRDGSRALTYGLIGAGTGLLTSLIAYASVSADPSSNVDNSKIAPVFIGFTVGFGALGAIIGAFSYKWKRLYFQSKDLSTTYIVYPRFENGSYGLGLLVNF